ncbi:hypothetical protein L3X38_003146 [Prunus dulcis]|uniref:Uncharacterized protein n=1 Tax=Prunus dulcis TaxID=3755 RepID=A0AAD5F1N2_PRUDU|nr:hypothetical protein L3X38_003146 [Prunus dulcis]
MLSRVIRAREEKFAEQQREVLSGRTIITGQQICLLKLVLMSATCEWRTSCLVESCFAIPRDIRSDVTEVSERSSTEEIDMKEIHEAFEVHGIWLAIKLTDLAIMMKISLI